MLNQGYSENLSAYKILDITTNKIILSRLDVFFKSNPGNSYLKNAYPKFQILFQITNQSRLYLL